MRILILVQYYPPERGSVRYARDLAVGLSARGHDVTVIAEMPHFPIGHPYPGFGHWKPRIRLESGVRVIRVPLVMGSNSQPLRRILGFLTFIISALPWALFTRRQDAIIASVPPATVSILGVLVSIRHRRRYFALLRDIEPLRALTLRRKADQFIGRLLIRAFRWVYRCAKHVVAVHPSELPALERLGIPSNQVSVIGHAVDIDAWSAHTTTAPISIARRPGRLIMLYAGTFGMVHGLPDLIAALAEARVATSTIDFIFLGDGQFREHCRDLVESNRLDQIRIMPSIDPDHIPSLLMQADFLLCSFRDDSDAALGTKFIEYCASGKPILVFGRCKAASLVTEIGNGLACTATDRAALHASLADFAARPGFWRDQGVKGVDYARNHFSLKDRIEQWERLLKSVSPAE